MSDPMPWRRSFRADPAAVEIADRHYNRQKIGSPQFVPPGRCLVLLAERALWVTSWPYAEHVRHAWAGAWMCSLFRREEGCPHRASDLIRQAVSATRHEFGAPPDLGMVTFVDTRKVRPKRDPGHTYVIAGFRPCGVTKDQGLIALQLLPGRMPPPSEPLPIHPGPLFASTLICVSPSKSCDN